MFRTLKKNEYQPVPGIFIVRERKITYGVGILVFFMGVGLYLAELQFHIKKIPVWIYFAILIICFSGIFFCIGIKNRKLIVIEKQMCYVNYLGKKKFFELSEIGHIEAYENQKKGLDYIILYNNNKEKLCKLDCCMQNSYRLIDYLHDIGIFIDAKKDTDNFIASILLQERILEENIGKAAAESYEKVDMLIKEWICRNQEAEVEFEYGLAVHDEDIIANERQLLSKEEKYTCTMEVYVKQDGKYVCYKKKKRIAIICPIIYRKQSDSGEKILMYSKDLSRIESLLEYTEKYLPGKLILDDTTLGYELKKTI